MNEQIDLAGFLVIAERVLGVDAKALNFEHPDGGQDKTVWRRRRASLASRA